MKLILKMFYWIYRFSNFHLLVIIIVTPAVWRSICWLVLEKRKVSVKNWRVFCAVLLLFFAFAILYVTIGMRTSGVREVCLTPFYSLIGMSSGAIQTCLLNILMFEPIGLLFPYVYKTNNCKGVGIWREIVFCILASTFIELIQYFFSLGTVETNDVIFNATGYVIGRANMLTIEKNKRTKKRWILCVM